MNANRNGDGQLADASGTRISAGDVISTVATARGIIVVLKPNAEASPGMGQAQTAKVQLEFIKDDVIKVRLAPTGELNAHYSSRAVVANNSASPNIELTRTDSTDRYVLQSASTIVEMSKHPFRIIIKDRSGRTLLSSHNEVDFSWNASQTKVYKQIAASEKVLGLGWRTGSLVRNGTRFKLQHKASYDDPEKFYAGVPLWYGVQQGGSIYGLFFDDASFGDIDVGSADAGTLSFANSGGNLDYYVFTSQTISAILDHYTALTGRPFLPPRWAIGFHQSRWSYLNDGEVSRLADHFRSKKIPCDAIWFDIDYMPGGEALKIDANKFQQVGGLLSRLRTNGFRSVFNISPYLFESDPKYSFALGKKYFVKNKDGSVFKGWHDYWYYVGGAPTGHLAWLDFTDANAVKWWQLQHQDFLKLGIDGVWNDLNEPQDLGSPWPDDLAFAGNGHPQTFKNSGHQFALWQTAATHEAMLEAFPNRRPFILSRSGSAGIQSYAALWSGDNVADWERGLKQNIPMGLSLSISGVPFNGHDVGGFFGYPEYTSTVNAELYVRWMQFGAFTPFFRQHKDGGGVRNYPRAEAWEFGVETEKIVREYINLRYQLQPYVYSLFAKASETGEPVQRPTFFDFQGDAKTLDQGHAFMFGPYLLVSPVTQAGAVSWTTYLPAGSQWQNWWNNSSYAGGNTVSTAAPLSTLPLFIRDGAIIPMREVQQFDGEKALSNLTWRLYPKLSAATSSFTLYEDDGETLNYRRNQFSKTTARLTSSQNQVSVGFAAPQGRYTVAPRTYALKIAWPFDREPQSVANDGIALQKVTVAQLQAGSLGYSYDSTKRMLEVKLADKRVAMRVDILY